VAYFFGPPCMSDLWLTRDHFVGKVSALGHPTRPTQPSVPPGSVNVFCRYRFSVSYRVILRNAMEYIAIKTTVTGEYSWLRVALNSCWPPENCRVSDNVVASTERQRRRIKRRNDVFCVYSRCCTWSLARDSHHKH